MKNNNEQIIICPTCKEKKCPCKIEVDKIKEFNLKLGAMASQWG